MFSTNCCEAMSDLLHATARPVRACQRLRQLLTIVLLLAMAGCATTVVQDFTRHLPAGAPRHIVLFFDGTANDASSRTNVARLFEITVHQNRSELLTWYHEGMGSDTRWIGAATGWGIGGHVRAGYVFLAQHHREGDAGAQDHRSLVGFSRGAYSARILLGLVELADLPMLLPATRASLGPAQQQALLAQLAEELFDAHKHDSMPTAERRAAIEAVYARHAGQLRRSAPVRLQAVALWDTVESLGMRGLGAAAAGENQRYHHSLCAADAVWHALALDDNRATSFAPQGILHPALVAGCANHPPRRHEVWFSGAHADVGGGYGDTSLASLSLNWMLQQLQPVGFLPPGAAVWADAQGRVHDAQAGNLLYRLLLDRTSRNLWPMLCDQQGLPAAADGHHCLAADGSLVPPTGRVRLHASVIERLRLLRARADRPGADGRCSQPGGCDYDARWYLQPGLVGCFANTADGLAFNPAACAQLAVDDGR